MCSFVQRAGEVVYLPESWLHATRNVPPPPPHSSDSDSSGSGTDGASAVPPTSYSLGVGMQAQQPTPGGALEAGNAVMSSFVTAMERISQHPLGQQPFPALFYRVARAAEEARRRFPKELRHLSELRVVEAKAYVLHNSFTVYIHTHLSS